MKRWLELLIWLFAIAVCAYVASNAIARWAHAHDPYTGIVDGNGISCCGGQDCFPLPTEDARYNPATDGWEVRLRGTWLPVPPQGVVRDRSPDGQMHACWWISPSANGVGPNTGGVHCLILPMMF